MKYLWTFLLLLLLPPLALADTKKIEGTTNVEDVYFDSTATNSNYGGSIVSVTDGDKIYSILIRAKNLASEIPAEATITGAVCSIYCYSNAGTETISAYRVFKPWGEGTLNGADPGDFPFGEGYATWNDWSNDDEEWTTAGCNSADDEGEDNSGDGTGADRKATAEDAESVDGVGWFAWNISTELAQGWYDGTINEEGVILLCGGTSQNIYYSTESAEAEKPFWVFTYTVGEPEAAGQVIIINQ